MRSRGEGVKIYEKIADVFYGCPLTTMPQTGFSLLRCDRDWMHIREERLLLKEGRKGEGTRCAAEGREGEGDA